MNIQNNTLKYFNLVTANNNSGISDFQSQVDALFRAINDHLLFEPESYLVAFEPEGTLFILE